MARSILLPALPTRNCGSSAGAMTCSSTFWAAAITPRSAAGTGQPPAPGAELQDRGRPDPGRPDRTAGFGHGQLRDPESGLQPGNGIADAERSDAAERGCG